MVFTKWEKYALIKRGVIMRKYFKNNQQIFGTRLHGGAA